jgi:hypothetical protein
VVARYQFEHREQRHGPVSARQRAIAHEPVAEHRRSVSQCGLALDRRQQRARSVEARLAGELLARHVEDDLGDEQEVFNGQPIHSGSKLPSNHLRLMLSTKCLVVAILRERCRRR